jgi:hypothetical protein
MRHLLEQIHELPSIRELKLVYFSPVQTFLVISQSRNPSMRTKICRKRHLRLLRLPLAECLPPYYSYSHVQPKAI